MAAALALACVAGVARPVVAQDSAPRWFPHERLIPALLAPPREVGFRGSFVLADRDRSNDFPGRNIEAEVAIGHAFPVLRLSEGGPGAPMRASLDFEVGTFSRFFMESARKDLINTDFRVGLPVSIVHGPWQVRLALRHISSHFGDDFLTAFEQVLGQASRDGFEAVVAHARGAGRLYAAGEYNFHRNARVSRGDARLGAEWDGGRVDRSAPWFFAAAEGHYATLSDDVAATFVAGVGFEVNGRTVLLEARAHVGPSPMGQLREVHESFFGLGMRIEP